MFADAQPGAVLPWSVAARRPPPPLSCGDVVLRAPPEVSRAPAPGLVTRMLPLTMVAAAVAMAVVFVTSGTGFGRNPMFLLFPATMLVSTVAMLAHAGRGGAHSAELDHDRKEYLRHLADCAERTRENARAQQHSLRWQHPDPASLWTLVGGPRMWERRHSDSDFCHVRVGIGTQRLAARITAPDLGPAERLEPVTATAFGRFVRAHSVVEDVPIAIALGAFGRVTVDGEAAASRAFLRATLCQLAVLHRPDQVALVAVVDGQAAPLWDWLKWLPHHAHPSRADGAGPVPMQYRRLDGSELEELRRLGGFARVVVVADGSDLAAADTALPAGAITVLQRRVHDGAPPGPGSLRLRVSATALAVVGADEEAFARPDALAPAEAEACARRLARYRRAADQHEAGRQAGWSRLLGIDDVGALDPGATWPQLGDIDRLRVPVGHAPDGRPIALDIKEAAEHGVGPHGLCVGATGSGKSELLRTFVAGLVATHPPDALNLVLVDFKGGATFRGFERCRHVAALITNLAAEQHLVARMADALAGEMHRRQELIRAAGDFASVADYEQARRAGVPLDPLPALVVIVDEFSELMSRHPDFADLFAAIGRLGRSLRIHLLLATQRLDEGRLRGLEAHLSYRICLKTFSASESRAVIGTPDAFHLSGAPGAAFLQAGAAEATAFQVAYVSDRYAAPPPSRRAAPAVFTAGPRDGVATQRARAEDPTAPTVLEVLLDRVAGHGAGAHRVWLPPLRASPTLDSLVVPGAEPGRLRAAIGLVDRPFEQRRDPLIVELAGAAGNVAVVGGPQTGKSTALCTLIAALAYSHPPRDAQFYCLDFGGGALSMLTALPHVGSVAGRAQPELARRTIRHVSSLLRRREADFRRHGIDSVAQFRARRSAQAGHAGHDGFGDVFLVIDGWAAVRDEFDDLTEAISGLAGAGLSYGIHVVLAASRWADIRPALRDQISTRIELRLGDPADSEFDRLAALQVPPNQPGRGITDAGRHVLLALPRIRSDPDTAGLAQGIGAVAEAISARFGGWQAPPVRLLPDRVDYSQLLAVSTGREIVIGLDEHELRPVAVDFVEQPHLLILGDSECGKTAALRLLCAEIRRSASPRQAQLVIVDFRRTLLGVVSGDHLAGYLASGSALVDQLPPILDRLRSRLPGPDIDQEQLRARSWWSGPELYVIVDDYDVVASSENPLAALVDLLAYAKDIGLHVIVARRAGGAARALFDPLLARLRDVGCMGLTMSSPPQEGVILGTTRPAPLPPGRATLTTRAAEVTVQLSWLPPRP